jgi:hypothetical protein
MAQKQNQIQLSWRTLEKLKQEINANPKDHFSYPPELVLANLQCEFLMGLIKENELCEKVENYF